MFKSIRILLIFLSILSLPNLASAYEGYYQNTNIRIELKVLAPENANTDIMEIPTIDGNLKKIQKFSFLGNNPLSSTTFRRNS